jgi:hypothetical protein
MALLEPTNLLLPGRIRPHHAGSLASLSGAVMPL